MMADTPLAFYEPPDWPPGEIDDPQVEPGFPVEIDPHHIPCLEEGLFEDARQERIASGEEAVCAVCGCSQSRACPGGCVWAAPNLCSRCALTGEADA